MIRMFKKMPEEEIQEVQTAGRDSPGDPVKREDYGRVLLRSFKRGSTGGGDADEDPSSIRNSEVGYRKKDEPRKTQLPASRRKFYFRTFKKRDGEEEIVEVPVLKMA